MSDPISIKVDISDAIRGLNDVQQRQIPYALSLALNNTAKRVVGKESAEIRDVFDRPNPQTLNSVTIFQYATKSQPTAIVGIKDRKLGKGNAPADWLRAQVTGGFRKQKRMERLLMSRTHNGQTAWVAPSRYTEDQYGNIKSGELQKLLAGLQLNPYAKSYGKKRNSLQRRGVTYFLGRPGGRRLPLGVWQKQGRKIKPILLFIDQPHYEKLFDFYYVADREVAKIWKQEWDKAWAIANGTANKQV